MKNHPALLVLLPCLLQAACIKKYDQGDYITMRGVRIHYQDPVTLENCFGRGKKFSPDSLMIRYSGNPKDTFQYLWGPYEDTDHTEIGYTFLHEMGGDPIANLDGLVMHDSLLLRLTYPDIDTLIIDKEATGPFTFYYNGELSGTKAGDDLVPAIVTVRK